MDKKSRFESLSEKEITRARRLAAENKDLKEKYKRVKEETATTMDSVRNTLKEIKNTYSSYDLHPEIAQNILDILGYDSPRD